LKQKATDVIRHVVEKFKTLKYKVLVQQFEEGVIKVKVVASNY
jgi:hypothetical protein